MDFRSTWNRMARRRWRIAIVTVAVLLVSAVALGVTPFTPNRAINMTGFRVQNLGAPAVASDATRMDDARFPTSSEKSALAGTSGAPGAGNKYVTDADVRNSDARTPTAHAASHASGGTDAVAIASLVAAVQTSANLVNNVTAGGTNDQIDDFSTSVGIDVVFAASQTDVNARLASIRNDIYQLSRKLDQVNDALRLYGLLN